MVFCNKPSVIFLLGLLSLGFGGCGKREANESLVTGPVEVGVVEVVKRDVPLEVELPGRTSAYRKAEVRPQVSGIIQKRLFTEGSGVNAGAPLYQIDPSPFEAALASAKAELASAEANLSAATARESRYKSLLRSKAVSRQEYEDAYAALSQTKAGVQLAKARVTSANINLAYTKVAAPIAGVIGRSAVTEGALVNAGQVAFLAEIQQLDPIYVDVSQSADQLLQLRRQMYEGSVSPVKAAKPRLLLGDGSAYELLGTLQFAEVGVSESTGTVTLRAQFPNPDRLLLPGMFVRMILEEGVRTGVMLVPQRSVTRDRSGSATAMVVNGQNVAELRQITLGRAVEDQWMVLEGLSVGDKVIVEGLQKVKPGAAVKPVAPAGVLPAE